MSDELKPGRHRATVSDYGISLTKAGKPNVNVKFKVGESSIIWFGSLNEGKALQMTMKTLIILGMKTHEQFDRLAEGISSNVLDTTKEVEIDIAYEEYDGQQKLRVKWVNEIGLKNTISAAEFKNKLAGVNIKNSFIVAKESLGQQSQPKKSDQELIDSVPF